MDLKEMIAELTRTRDDVSEAIRALELLALSHGKRRGRPPAWMTAAKQRGPKRLGRPPGSRNKPKTSEHSG